MQFVKSTWFKCVTVLLAISVIAGSLLAVLNDVLYVSPEERTGRALTKIYERQVSSDEYSVELDAENASRNEKELEISENGKVFGAIQKIFVVGKDDEADTQFDMLFRAVGFEGYKNGTVTTWVKVSFNNGSKQITKVIIDGYEKQTLMSKLDKKFTDKFVDITTSYDTYFSADKKTGNNVVAGATMSARAGCNSVNCVLKYLEDNNL